MLGAFEDVIELSGELTEAMAAQDDSKAAELFPELGERSQEAEQLARQKLVLDAERAEQQTAQAEQQSSEQKNKNSRPC